MSRFLRVDAPVLGARESTVVGVATRNVFVPKTAECQALW